MQIRLLTWNIHKCIGMDRRFDPDRVAEVIRHHQPDVLLLQEVDRGVPRSRRLALDLFLAEATGYPFHAWQGTHHLTEGAYGNAVLSRFPIRRKRTLDLTVGRRKRRGCLYVRLKLPGHYKDLHVLNWHLGLSAAERSRQVERLLRAGTVRKLKPTDRVILGGDTNDWRNRLFLYAGLKAAGFHAWSEHGRRRHVHTYPSMAPVGALDKFFWRGPLYRPHLHRSRLALARVASDHLPLLAEFSLT